MAYFIVSLKRTVDVAVKADTAAMAESIAQDHADDFFTDWIDTDVEFPAYEVDEETYEEEEYKC